MGRLSVAEVAFRYKCCLVSLETGTIYLVLFGLFLIVNWQVYLIWLTVIFLLALVIELGTAFNYVRQATVQENDNTLILRKGRFVKRQIMIPKDKIYGIIKKENILQDRWGLATLEIQTTAGIYQMYGLDKSRLNRFMVHWQKNNSTDKEST